jgi:hypothetical protein
MKEPFKHPVISSVVAGLILSFLAWIGGFIPGMWTWIKQVAEFVWLMFTYELLIPLWLLIPISAPLIVWLARATHARISRSSGDSAGSNTSLAAREKTIELTDDENEVMQLFIQADGRSLDANFLKYSLRFSTLKIEQIIEVLEEKQLIEIHNDYIHGTKFFLTRTGRDFMIGNKYISVSY